MLLAVQLILSGCDKPISMVMTGNTSINSTFTSRKYVNFVSETTRHHVDRLRRMYSHSRHSSDPLRLPRGVIL
jgi:hypothetical protein